MLRMFAVQDRDESEPARPSLSVDTELPSQQLHHMEDEIWVYSVDEVIVSWGTEERHKADIDSLITEYFRPIVTDGVDSYWTEDVVEENHRLVRLMSRSGGMFALYDTLESTIEAVRTSRQK